MNKLPKIPDVVFVLTRNELTYEIESYRDLVEAMSECEVEALAWDEWRSLSLNKEQLMDESFFRDYFSDHLFRFIEEAGYTITTKAKEEV